MNNKKLYELRDFYYSSNFFNVSFDKIIKPLINSFIYKRGIPLKLESSSNYYTSTTATTLLSLYHIKAIDEQYINKFHDTLFWLKDNTKNSVVKEKNSEDRVAWDVSESASVWATSLSLWALIDTKYKGDRLNEIKDAIIWLANQQKENGGWGFDIKSPSRIYFSALAIYTIQKSLKNITFSEDKREYLKKIKQVGLQYILEKKIQNENEIYWTTKINQKEEPDPTTTLYAIMTLYKENKNKYKQTINMAINFLRHQLKDEIWDCKKFIEETDTKYGTQKIIISFTPSFIIPLLRFGIDPYDEIIIKPLFWLRKNRLKNGWSMPGYSKDTLSFATAYSLWAITLWHKYALNNLIKNVSIIKPFKIVVKLRKRIRIFLYTTLFLLSLYIIEKTNIINHFKINTTEFYIKYGLIGFLSFFASIITILGLVYWIDKNYLNNKIKNIILNKIKNITDFIYIRK
jgi:hypothetical protein